ncbi:MAG: hypothetical protein R3355_11620 [Pseudomonas sp.]|uniref:hypothetical protein n=1 Tax=Pseudomonas sp. TaxID=306 RepID=UPI00299E1FEB|nr:hypothetical protein [Pseudomonas sp.]MDX1723734.1 hypothetical protein [Pseudomonas sp.]
MYYQILINGMSLGIFGHPNVQNMHLSLMVTAERREIFANAVCQEGEDLYMIDWLQYQITVEDVVEFKQVLEGPVPEPRKKYKIRASVQDA